MLRYSGVMILACLVLAAVAFYEYRAVQTPPYMHGDKIKILEAIQYWKDRISVAGPERAHDEMARQGENMAASRHILAHTFGEALYAVGGLTDISYCGAGEYLFGCYHQFIGLATAQYGSSVMRKLKDGCENVNSPLNCSHGIGHGLISTYGYSMKGVQKSLAECHSFYEQQMQRGICADGMFMEYNLQEITTLDQNRIPRTFSSEHALEPCFSIGSEFKDECIYELPLWWYAALSASSTDVHLTFGTMGDYCRKISDTHGQNICFIGIGFPAAQSLHFDVEKIADACRATSRTPKDYMLCASGAAERYVENSVAHENICGREGRSARL